MTLRIGKKLKTSVLRITMMNWYGLIAVICLLLPVFADKHVPIITRNHPLIVSYGRTLWLDPEQHLKIEVPSKYRCEVSVIRSDPLAERTGYLTPDKFPCDFENNEVRYVHLGSKAPSKDFVKLSVRVDTPTQTIFRRVVLDITVNFLPMEIVKKNNDLTVEAGKISKGINDETLEFVYDTTRMEACRVIILDRLDSKKGLPRYGQLLNITKSAESFARPLICSDFLAADIRYKHNEGVHSPNRDYIPMAVEIHRQTGVYVKEYFQVAVRIYKAKANNRPTASFRASEFMSVDQYVTKLITTDILDAEDIETNSDYLIFNITQGPSKGSIIRTDDPHTPITSFYRKDIKDLKIAYKPPSQMANLKETLGVVFEVLDTEAFHSEPITLLIEVSPRNTLSPMVTKNKELVLFEGQSRLISSEDNLQISDKDNIEDVKIYIVGGLRHGELYVNRKVARWFVPTDLDNGTIIYQHDNSDTYSDNIILNATDGNQYVEFVFLINIIPVDDEMPVVVCNTGLELEKGGSAVIDEYSLRASDIDSDSNKISFLVGPQIQHEGSMEEEIAKPGLQAGFLILRQKEKPIDDTMWSKLDSDWIKTNVDSFTLEDILLRKLYYVHNGVEVFEDRFYFQLVDNAERPNQSLVKVFNILIKQIDVNLPQVDSDCTMYAEVKDSKSIKLSRKMLWFIDTDSDDMELVYTIKKTPYFVLNQTSHAGSIISTDRPDIILSNFTQRQLRHHKVSYKPPFGLYRYMDMDVQFKFSVSDQAGHAVDNQIFHIKLHAERSHVNPSKVIKLLVNTDGKLYFSSRHKLGLQRFVIVALPSYGTLYKNGKKLDIGVSFTANDITNQRLLYVQRSTEEKLDEVLIRETSGRGMATFQIQAASKPDKTNTQIKNQPPTLVRVSTINVEEAGSVIITSQELQATDPDTDDLKLFFLVNAFPRRGELLVNGSVVNNFTQLDVINHLVVYRHGVEEIGVQEAHDFFNLTLSDGLHGQVTSEAIGTQSTGFTFHVRISPVDDKEPVIKINDHLQVWEGEKVTVTTRNLKVTDADTIPDDITCRIDASPLLGFLENISPSKGMEQSQEGIPIMSFTVNDLLSQRINYVQKNHIGNEVKMDLFALSCSDGLKNSQRHMMIINIHGKNDEVPELFLANFQVEEGKSMEIDTILLEVTDRDVPKDNLTIKLLKPPKHGVIKDFSKSPPQVITSFSFNKVKQKVITYIHDNTETTEDILQFAVTDGLHEVRKDLIVNILPVDDETPRLITNTGLGLTSIGETRMISSSALRADDVDSPNENLTYSVQSLPSHGQLSLYEHTGHVYNLSRGSTFTQRDIDRGMVFYTDLSVVAVSRKEIRFDVSDGKNALVNQVFYIYMKPEDKVYPIVFNKGVQLKKGSSITLTTKMISSRDPDSPDTKLEYYITTPPSKGIITMAGQPNVPISKFSQLHLAGSQVKYVHTSQDGSNVDSFQFEVSDGQHQVMRKFRISLFNGDNTHTMIKYDRLTVKEGQTKEITSFELKAEDPDNAPDTLVFSITQIPVNGFVMKRGKPTMTFTQEDIDNNFISYQHDGTDTTHDSFSFTISDGTHLEYYVYSDSKTLTRRPQTIEIDIQAIDNKTPQIIVNRGGTTLEPVTGGGLGLCLSSDLLKAFDPDSNNTQVKYLISDPLNFGTLINIAKGNESVTEFRQSDVDENLIYFVLNKNEMNATSDRFYFDLIDPGMNELLNQRFSMHWARISLNNIVYSVSEVHSSVVITLTRNGFLGESSFIGIRTVDESAKTNQDFIANSADQVQFNPGERYKTWVILLLDDKLYEGSEWFTVQIHSPVMAIIGGHQEAKITITDPEDRSVISVSKLKYSVEESSGLVNVGLYRHGDLSKRDQIWCVTQSGTAIGTYGSSIESYTDFISRTKNTANIVVFQQGERVKNCSVQLIDDSLYENEEEFSVYIMPSAETIVSSRSNQSVVMIKPDTNDEPRVYFDRTRYIVDENGDICEVTVKRAGSDLSGASSVIIRSKKTNPVSAKANMDYIPVSKTLYFAPDVQTQTIHIVILDDLGQPIREGLEYFELSLGLPVNARVAVPERALVVINDSHSDLPRIQFQESLYTIDEENGMLSAMLVRSGDLSHVSTVRCYTRQITARAGVDYYERSNSDDDVVKFEVGEKTQKCPVAIIDDSFYEGNEEFRLVLGQLQTQHGVAKSLIGKRSYTTIRIVDKNDRSGIGFEKTRYFVNEPSDENKESYVKLIVLRNGDTSKTSQVRLYTKDGSAKADTDFTPLSKVLTFGKNVTRLEEKIKIKYDDEREMREAFTVHLTKDRNRVALIESNKVIVYIQENLHRTGVTFPLIPTVVSLRDYDDISKAKKEPFQGYPLICVTACDPKHPRYPETGSLCSRQSIDNTKTWYSWEVSAATGPDGVTNEFRSIDSQTFFASTSMITLDSIYFGPGSRVRCTARAITYHNYKGLDSTSDPVTISRKEGLCLPQKMGDIGSESFSAQITYTGVESSSHPNMIQVRVLVPHIDGLLPAISTKSLSNFEITLTADASRRGHHLCSNLLDTHEVQTKHGFLSDHVTRMSGGTEPYQYSTELRGKSTLRFYRNLNLESCMWTFENYYTMSELVQECGGRIATDGQVHDLTRSHLSVRVPLYVSYIYHSPSALGGWMHFDHSSNLKMSFTYDTTLLWKDSIGTPEGSVLKGYLHPTGVLIRPQDKRLVVTFKTVARFRGIFILAREDQNMFSMVVSPDQPNLSFQLKLLRSTPTYNSPEQMWQFISEFSVRDYSGTYYIKLIPCTVTQNVKYSVPLKCNPRLPITFTLPIRFQQTSDPDAVEFNIRTQFFLLARRDVWLSNETNKVMEQSDAAFSLGSVIYGRIMVDPQQSLGSAYHVSVEKVFVCSGLDGYIPEHNPDSGQYGCLADSKLLSYRFKILDRGAPHVITQKFRNVPFAAKLAIDDENAHTLVEQPNSDGFRFDSSPLFQVASGRQWYLHAIYTIRSSRSSTRGIGKRSTVIGQSSHIHSLSKRSNTESTEKSSQGAALLRSIKLIYDDNEYSTGGNNAQGDIRKDASDDGSSSLSLKWVLIVVITVCFILMVAVIVLIMLYRRKSPPVTTKVVDSSEAMQGTEV